MAFPVGEDETVSSTQDQRQHCRSRCDHPWLAEFEAGIDLMDSC